MSSKESEEEWVDRLYKPEPERMKFISPISREEMTDLSQTRYLIPKEEKDSGFDEWQHEYDNKSLAEVLVEKSRPMPDSFADLWTNSRSNLLDPKGEAGSTKTPLWLVPPEASRQAALVHAHGAKKYGAFNWRATRVCASTYISALQRHFDSWRDGEDNDPESGLSHLAHVAANINILLDAAACGVLEDDRHKRPTL